MREIKFRAWIPSKKQMLYFARPGFNHEYNHLTFDWLENGEYISAPWNGGKTFPFDEFESVGDDFKFEIMQYTGLKDRNGKEIFEGDIVRVGEYIGEVKFKDGAFDAFGQIDGQCDQLYWSEAREPDSWEVVGNIYENPVLLTTPK